jgi:hypothetical protein
MCWTESITVRTTRQLAATGKRGEARERIRTLIRDQTNARRVMDEISHQAASPPPEDKDYGRIVNHSDRH